METNDFDDFIDEKKTNKTAFGLQDDRIRVVLAFILIGIAGFLLLSFSSFLFTWEQDQSVFDNSITDFLFNKEISVENWGGKIGALLSKKIIHDWIGVSAFLIVVISLFAGLKLFRITHNPLRNYIRNSAVLMILGSLVTGFIFRDLWDANIGGAHGYFITEWLISIIGEFGTGVVFLVLSMTYIVFTFTKSASSIISIVSVKKKNEVINTSHFENITVQKTVEPTIVEPPQSKEPENVKSTSIDDAFERFAQQARKTESVITNEQQETTIEDSKHQVKFEIEVPEEEIFQVRVIETEETETES